MQLSLVGESQSPIVSQPQGDRSGVQLLRFRLRCDRWFSRAAGNSAQAECPDMAEMAMKIGRSGSADELKTAIVPQGPAELIYIPSDRVVPIPHLPPPVLGVYNWRGEVLWVVDLAVLLGAKERQFHAERQSYSTIVVRVLDRSGETKTIGLAVDEIADIEWCELVASPAVTIDPPQLELSPWVKGHAIAPNGTRITILDELAIVDRAELHAEI
jgi:positive phototaxis protein PixI